MKKLIRLIVVLTIALVVFKMVDEENYMRVKSLINSLRIYNEKGTDRYYLIYDLDEKMKDLEGSMVYLHGRPLKSQINLLPQYRQKHRFDNWDFKLEKSEGNIFVRTIESKAKKFTSVSMGIYRLPDGSVLPGKDVKTVSLKDVDLAQAGEIEGLDLNNLTSTDLKYSKKDLNTFGYYKKLEMNPINTGVIFTALLAMAWYIVGYVEKVAKEEYKDKKDIPKLLSLIIVGIYPIFIFLKLGAVSTIVDILWVLLIIRILLRERIERKNIVIYLMLITMLGWWYYVARTGIDADSGMRMYSGKLIKYFSLPILFSLVRINWERLKKIGRIYLLASTPYMMYFIDRINLPRFGDGWATQHMAQIMTGAALLGLLFLLFGRLNIKLRVLYAILFIFASIMVLKSGARGVWIAYLPLVVMIICLKDWKKAAVAITIMVGIGIYFIKSFPDNYYVKRVVSIEKLEAGRRFDMWKLAPEIIKTHPLKGIGLNGFKTYIHEENNLVERELELKENLNVEKEKENPDQRVIEKIQKKLKTRELMKYEGVHIHNTFLEVLIATGIVGFILYFTALFTVLKRVWVKYKESGYINEKIFLMWMLLFNAVQGIYGLTEYTLPIEVVQQSIWFIMAIALNYEVIRDEK